MLRNTISQNAPKVSYGSQRDVDLADRDRCDGVAHDNGDVNGDRGDTTTAFARDHGGKYFLLQTGYT